MICSKAVSLTVSPSGPKTCSTSVTLTVNKGGSCASPIHLTVDPGVSNFQNEAVTFYRYCEGGAGKGVAACISVDAGVFTSDISQADADAQAKYAASLESASPGPCCSSDSATRMQDVSWDITQIGGGFTGTPTGDGTAFADLPPGGGGETTTDGVEWTSTWCNPWPAYNLDVTIDWAVTGTGGAVVVGGGTADGFRIFIGTDDGSLGDITVTDPPLGSTNPRVNYATGIDNKAVILVCDGLVAAKSGTFKVTIPITTLGSNKLIIEAVNFKFYGLVGPTVSFVISSIKARPLTPPVTTKDCTVISALPSPFHYADRPANDDFANATLITGISGTVSGSNLYASLEFGEVSPYNGGETSIWYKWVAPANGSVTFTTVGSDFDTMLSAHTGMAVDTLTLVVKNDDGAGISPQSRITFTAVMGTTYYIRVDGFGDPENSVVLNWS